MGAQKSREAIACAPLTPERWNDLKTVFGPNGAFCGCWCQFWRLPRPSFDAALKAKTAEASFRREVRAGPAPGLLAYRGGAPVGWVRTGPRAETPQWNGSRRLSAPLDPADGADEAVWAITCFVVPRRERGAGVATALLAAAIEWARREGARAIDACPVEADAAKNPVSIYHGIASTFRRLGFFEIARRKDGRPLMRLDLAAPEKKRRAPRKSV